MGITPKNDNLLRKSIAYWAMLFLLFLPAIALAADPPRSAGVLDDSLNKFHQAASQWESVIRTAAEYLFFALGTISLVYTYGTMLLRKADIGEFFSETVRFMLFFGFFLWLLKNGPAFANDIVNSLADLAEKASTSTATSPSQVIDVGIKIAQATWDGGSIWDPFVWLGAAIVAVVCLILLAAVGINLFILYAASYIVLYAGFFVLGFGGSRWTSDIAINYYKTAIGMALKLMTMILIIGIFNSTITTYYSEISGDKGLLEFVQIFTFLVFCLACFMISHSVPDMVAGLVSGGAAGVGNMSGGAVAGAMVGAAASLAGAAAAMKAAGAAFASKSGGDSKGGNAMEAASKGLAEAGGDGVDSSMFDTGTTKQPPPPAKAAQAAQAGGGGGSGGGGASSSGGGGDSGGGGGQESSSGDSGGGGGDASSSGGDSSGDSSSDSGGDSSNSGGDASSGGDSPNTDVGGQSDSGGDKGGSKGASGSDKGSSKGGGAGSRALSAISKVDSAIGSVASGAVAMGGAVASKAGEAASKVGAVAAKAGKAVADPVKNAAKATAAAAPNLTSALGATARGAGAVGRVAGTAIGVAGQMASAAIDEKISKTTGGKIATALNAKQEAAQGHGDTYNQASASLSADRQAEVDAFVNKHKKS